MLKPIDILNYTLKTSVNGYNKKDTDAFIASVFESYKAILQDNKDLQDKITSLGEGINYYKEMENTLQKALIIAEKTSSEIQEEAKAEAAKITKDAQASADKIIEEAKAETAKIIKEAKAEAAKIIKEAKVEVCNIKSEAKNCVVDIKEKSNKLVQNYENYRTHLKELATSQLELLESEEFELYVPEQDVLENAVEKKFLWNSDEYTVAKSSKKNIENNNENEDSNENNSDNENGFIFIDTE